MPDAGARPMPDAGARPVPDAGAIPMPDAGATPIPDAGARPMPDAGARPMPDAGANLSEHNQIIALQTRIEEMADARQAEDDRWRKTATDTLGTLQFAVAKLE